MDRGQCCAVYVDDRVRHERWISKSPAPSPSQSRSDLSSFALLDEPAELQGNTELFLQVFKQVYLCNSGTSFSSKLSELSELSGSDCIPTFAFIDIQRNGFSGARIRRSTTPTGTRPGLSPPSRAAARRSLTFFSQSEESYGLQLLSKVSADLQVREEPHLIVPIAVVRSLEETYASFSPAEAIASDMKQISMCLDAGAVDVLVSPLDASRVNGLCVHAYRTQKAALRDQSRFLATRKMRKQSWVGADDQQPFSYLREAMVSKLMKRICNPEEAIDEPLFRELRLDFDRKLLVENEVGKWSFSAHTFSDDELIHAACAMLEHALRIPELEEFRLSTEDLHTFMLACREAYNSFVFYHNFRHAVDVLQSTFLFLLEIGALPRYPNSTMVPTTREPISSLLTPLDAFTLLITAIGHDVGHPGVNNIFLVKLNAPLAQLYNDTSVLEAFHCAAYSQILRRHWPCVFENRQLRKLMISSILATDMGLHHKFIESMGQLQQRYRENNSTEGWKPQDVDTYRTLLCGLLIKCADISNVARVWDTAQKWTDLLQQEFANQGDMEKTIGMETALFGGPPELGNLVKLATGQMGFMTIFALPLFDGMADLFPEMSFASEEIGRNKSIWQDIVDRETKVDSVVERARSNVALSQAASSTPPTRRLSKSANGNILAELDKPRHVQSPPTSWINPPQNPPLDDKAPHLSGASTGTGQSLQAKGNPGTDMDSQGQAPSSYPNWSAPQESSQRCPVHRPFQRSAGRVSVVTTLNRQSEATSGVRTQSTSTYTNNTVTTPISATTTQASSVISGDGRNDEKDQFRQNYLDDPEKKVTRSSYDESESDDMEEKKSRATPVPISSCYGYSNPHGIRSAEEVEKPSSHFMSAPSSHFLNPLFDKTFSNGQNRNGRSRTRPTSPASMKNYLPSSPPAPEHESHPPPNTNGRTVPRRRSRLRLAFWRRNKQPSPSTTRSMTSDEL
ncbi:hypothetical protein AJ80_04181 [Polytolypa hystricis UAMH7299]|uniref:Phosphodiesterase n=1 Tax=Polytolypa hystricis (strain UAMH7299) TaxID=1447883 RepID=A0A2B7YDE2_POLH7|nr:hypothetical protein AJ80_04181 [Polytolypa hystricis UAMH7299]